MSRSTTTQAAEFITPRQLARRLGIAADKVYGWISSGQLRAVNLAENPDSERPRWRISEAVIEEFISGRSNAPAPPKPTPTRRRRRPAVKDYFA